MFFTLPQNLRAIQQTDEKLWDIFFKKQQVFCSFFLLKRRKYLSKCNHQPFRLRTISLRRGSKEFSCQI
jgi:hypothetical protein